MNDDARQRFGEYFEPTEVSQETRQVIVDLVQAELTKGSGSYAGPSDELRRMVKARVRLADFTPYLAAERLIAETAGEIDDLGGRVHAYQYVERYRFAFEGMSNGMSTTFIRHVYEIRHNEVYAIRERAIKLLAFLHEVASLFSLPANLQTKVFARRFDKLMEYRLRVRHKSTHFHEAPSMTGRLLEVAGMVERTPENQRPGIIAVLTSTIAKLSEAARHLGLEDDREEFHRAYLLAVDAEAAKMWKIIGDHIHITLGLPTN